MSAKQISTKRFLVEVTRDINAIPKGIYQVEEGDVNNLTLTVMGKVFFGIIGSKPGDVKLIPRNRLNIQRKTSLNEFLDRYYELCRSLSPRHPTQLPFTFCMMDPSVAREVA